MSLLSSHWSTYQGMLMRKFPKGGENHPTEAKEKNLWCSLRARKKWVSRSQMDKHAVHGILGTVHRRYYLRIRAN